MRHRIAAVVLAALLVTGCTGNRTEGRFGAELFGASCAGCHRGDGSGSGAAPALTAGTRAAELTDEQIIAVIRVGPGAMPGFQRLSEEQVGSLVTFIRDLQGDGAG